MKIERYFEAYDELYRRRESAQLELRGIMQQPRNWEMLHTGALSQVKMELRTFMEVCDHADPFYIDPDTALAIGRASEALPLDYKFSVKDLPQDFGFIWCHKELPVDRDDYTVEYGPTAMYPIKGMAWGVAEQLGIKKLFLYNIPDEHFVQGFLKHNGVVKSLRQFSTLTSWSEGSTIRDLVESETIEEELQGQRIRVLTPPPANQIQWFIAFCLWVQGEILTTSPQRLPRHTLRKHKIHEGSVRIVTLRRRQYVNKKEGDGEPVEWSCRWLVRGHWRRVRDKKTGEEKTVWVRGYIKGPSDKPFKQPKQNLFAVTR